MSMRTYRVAPLTEQEIVNAIDQNSGYFTEKVLISLDDVIDCEGIDGFNNILESELLSEEASCILSDISYEVVGNHDGSIIVEVTACLERTNETDE